MLRGRGWHAWSRSASRSTPPGCPWLPPAMHPRSAMVPPAVPACASLSPPPVAPVRAPSCGALSPCGAKKAHAQRSPQERQASTRARRRARDESRPLGTR
eukprot:12327112-Alexandrium_andersonii.AAC.1